MRNYTVHRSSSTSAYGVFRRCWHVLPLQIRQLNFTTRIKSVIRNRFATHDDLYDATYYERRREPARRSAEIIGQYVARIFAKSVVLDVGCATGDLLCVLRELGVDAFGLEYSQAAIEVCCELGLRVQRFDLELDEPTSDITADVIVSTEVAEHLPEACADRYVSLLCCAKRAIVFTAAPPGQDGTDHVNLQPQSYWISKFIQQGLTYDSKMTNTWQKEWKTTGMLDHYWRNLMIFVRTD